MKGIYLVILLFFFSCVSQHKKNLEENILSLKNSYCKAPFKYNYQKEIPSLNSDSILSVNNHLRASFSDQSVLILNALGGIDEVEDIILLKKDSTIKSQMKILQLKSAINSKINIAMTELDAVAAEYDCEGERVAQMAYYVDNINSEKNNRVVYYSIVAGALTSITGAIITNDNVGNVVDIGGGVLGVGLGFATLNPKGKKVEFIHNRNILGDVWKGKLDSDNFPPFVWYMYSEKKFWGNTDNKSMLEHIKERWLKFNFENDLDAANNSVNFNEGGTYLASDLHNRNLMLNQMQSATRTIHQIINYLLLDLDKFVYEYK